MKGVSMTDTFHKEYKPLTEEQKTQMIAIKGIAESLETAINESTTPQNGREMAVAKTNLETAIMWAIKGVTA